MSWKYDGYTKVKVGSGKSARYEGTFVWKCSECGHELRGGKNKPVCSCPNCGKDGDGE